MRTLLARSVPTQTHPGYTTALLTSHLSGSSGSSVLDRIHPGLNGANSRPLFVELPDGSLLPVTAIAERSDKPDALILTTHPLFP